MTYINADYCSYHQQREWNGKTFSQLVEELCIVSEFGFVHFKVCHNAKFAKVFTDLDRGSKLTASQVNDYTASANVLRRHQQCKRMKSAAAANGTSAIYTGCTDNVGMFKSYPKMMVAIQGDGTAFDALNFVCGVGNIAFDDDAWDDTLTVATPIKTEDQVRAEVRVEAINVAMAEQDADWGMF
jgi:hypothetical protein